MDSNDVKYCIECVKRGDTDAFGSLVNAYEDLVYTICVRMLTVSADAEEAAQDVFVNAFLSLESFQAMAKFSTWLYRIAYNHCLTVIRSKGRRIKLVEEVHDGELYGLEIYEEEMNGLEYLSMEERRRYLKAAIESLEEADAVVITLFYYDELSLEEISEVTGLSSSNIRVKLHRSRKKMHRVICENLKSEVCSIL